MSDLTMCNYCNLDWIKKRHAGKTVELKPEDAWLRVYVDGKPYGALFKAITESCVC